MRKDDSYWHYHIGICQGRLETLIRSLNELKCRHPDLNGNMTTIIDQANIILDLIDPDLEDGA